MENSQIIEYLQKLDKTVYVHASNLLKKFSDWNTLSAKQKIALPKIGTEYVNYLINNNKLKGYSDKIIIERTKHLNNYFDFHDNKFKNYFTSQGKFRSTILEEFMFILFNDLIEEVRSKIENSEEKLKLGSKKAYTNLFFSGTDFYNFVETPQIGIHQKDQDFAIYRPINISIGKSKSINTNLPIVSIENKTYIDKTMLEGSIATAEKIKSGNPYSLFFVVSERYAVDLKIDPVYSKIDQIYVLRKDNKKNTTNPVFSDVLIDLIQEVNNHLNRNWSDVENKLNISGKII